MQTTLTAWWVVVLSCACLVFSEENIWESLIQKLKNDWERNSVVPVVVNRWNERPPDFFRRIGKEPWEMVAKHLSDAQIGSIRPEEFESIPSEFLKTILYYHKACPTIDISFWTKDRIQHISAECLHKIISESKSPVKLGQLWEAIDMIIMLGFNDEAKSCLKSIDHDDFEFMQPDVLRFVLPLVPDICSALGVSFWTEKTIASISAECLHFILKQSEKPVRLGRLWKRIEWFTIKRFTEEMRLSWLNIDRRDFKWIHPVALELILSVRGPETEEFSSEDGNVNRIDWDSLKLKLNNQNCHSAVITILDNWAQHPLDFFQGLEEKSWQKLARHLSDSQISEIPLEEFDLMTLGVLQNILFDLKICPTADISFWTEERIQYISSGCLHKILTENQAPVELGKLWQRVNMSSMLGFSAEEKSCWQNIARKDFYFMQPGVLKYLLSFPKVCSALGVSFWTNETIESITSECLYIILREAKESVKLGELWQRINSKISSNFDSVMRLSWKKIDSGDFHFMRPDTLKIILASVPKVCPTLGLSFWTEKTIEAISTECLHTILEGAKESVKLGELWRKIDLHVVQSFTDEHMRSSLRKIDHGDFYYMQPEVLRYVLKYFPNLCSDLGLSFWTKETIRGISGECLHELLTKDGTPARLESMWSAIPVASCHGLLQKMNFSLDSVHPDDRALAGDWIGNVIKMVSFTCRSLSISFWNKETIKYMTKDCLYNVITAAKSPVEMGELWAHIPRQELDQLGGYMFYMMKNVVGSDFRYMPASLLQSIFSSEAALSHLPQPLTQITLSTKASKVSMGPVEFSILTKSAPNIAVQLLWYSTNLPENILSKCEGSDIHVLNLALPNVAELDWKGLFAVLESKYSLHGRAEHFSKMIRLISEDAAVHFCTTLSDPDEYLSLAWLHRNLSDKCRSKLPFDPEYVSRLFSTLDFSKESQSWATMLGVYSDTDWALFSQSKRAGALLGKDCDLWGMIETGGWVSVFEAQSSVTLKNVLPDCVLKMPGILASNCEKIALLADDAFSKHAAGQLPCHISSLSPAQIVYLSKNTVENADKPTAEEISRHALSRVTLDDLKALNFQQFKSLYDSQWAFVPGGIKNDALGWHLEMVQSKALNIMVDLNKDTLFNRGKSNLDELDDNLKFIQDMLSLVGKAYRNGYRNVSESSLASLIRSIQSSSFLRVRSKVFEESTLLKPVAACLVLDAKQLRDYIRRVFKDMGAEETKLPLSHDKNSGFDRSGIIISLSKTPELFAAPNARVSSEGITDNGGVIRALNNQLLDDIQRDLVVPYTRAASLSSESPEKVAMNDWNGLTLRTINDYHNGNAKFVWGISRKVGLIVGLVFGKALQLDVRLPFALDRVFYGLLVDGSDEAIRHYYLETYEQEISRFRQGIADLFNMGDLEEPLQTLTRPESLRFTLMSTKAEREEAKNDIMTKTNVWACNDQDCYVDIKELEGEKFVEKYTKAVLEKVQSEFKEFIHELIRGLGMALPPAKEFGRWPMPFLRPFADFLPQLLNVIPVSADDLTAKIDVGSDDIPVEFAGRNLPASKVLFAFIRSLEGSQPSHLLGVWSGATTISLEHIRLNVTFIRPDSRTSSVRVDFCNATGTLVAKSKPAIASGKDYKRLFDRFVKELIGEAETHEVDCPEDGLEFYPTRVATCSKSLMVYSQSLQQIFGSLVDLLNTPLTAIRD